MQSGNRYHKHGKINLMRNTRKATVGSEPMANVSAQERPEPALDSITAAYQRLDPDELHLFTSWTIPELDLVDYAQSAAERLLAAIPSVVFTSGRRDSNQQADAMAGNVVSQPRWIEETYSQSQERDTLQGWVDSHPAATTKAEIAGGLVEIMSNWTDDQKKLLSRHFSGQAFDVQPVAGALGEAIKKAIQNLPNLRRFLDAEGGLTIWHADFEKSPD